MARRLLSIGITTIRVDGRRLGLWSVDTADRHGDAGHQRLPQPFQIVVGIAGTACH